MAPQFGAQLHQATLHCLIECWTVLPFFVGVRGFVIWSIAALLDACRCSIKFFKMINIYCMHQFLRDRHQLGLLDCPPKFMISLSGLCFAGLRSSVVAFCPEQWRAGTHLHLKFVLPKILILLSQRQTNFFSRPFKINFDFFLYSLESPLLFNYWYW